MGTPNFSSISIPESKVNSKDTELVQNDIDSALIEHNISLNQKKIDINTRIKNLDTKIIKLGLKEGMLDIIIDTTYRELESFGPTEFTRRGQKQTVLLKQLESLNIVNDTLLKYEDTIQKYYKILIDLDNNKFNSIMKLESVKKEEKKADENIADLLTDVQQLIHSPSSGGTKSLMTELEEELIKDGF